MEVMIPNIVARFLMAHGVLGQSYTGVL